MNNLCYIYHNLQHNPKLKLIVAGHQSYPELFRKVPNCEAYGYIPREKLEVLFNECALFAMPAIHEPWGLVYLEALSLGMPVLGLQKNALPEMTENGKYGFLLEGQPTAEKIASALLKAHSQPDKLAKMGMEAMETIPKRYSWEKTAKIIVEKIYSYFDNKNV